MLKNIDVEKILKAAMSDGGDFAEIFAECTATTSISHENRKIERVVAGIDAGYGLRVVRDGKTAYGYTNDANELMNVAASLRGAPSASRGTTKQSRLFNCTHEIATPPPAASAKKPADRRNDNQSLQLITLAAKTAWAKNDAVKQVQVNFKDTHRKVAVANSNGLLIEDEKNDKVMVVMVIAEKDGVIQTGYEPAFENFDAEIMAETAVKRALLMLKAKHAPRGLMSVVISSSAGGTMIHEAVGHGLEADLAGEGMSVYKEKLGQKVASPLITVVDDATLTHQRGSFKFDDEGHSAQRTVLIEKGVLKNYLQSAITSKKMGMKPTGNGRRESYRNRPIPRMTNTIVTPGSDDPEKIIASVSKGLLVKKMGGGQVNTINGDFVFEAQEAYLIENGKMGEPVRGATLIGNGPKVLMEIDMVGRDLGFGIGTCGKEGQGVPVAHGMPTVRVPSITVGGAD